MILPSSLNTGLSSASVSRVVSGRMPWSVDVGVAVDLERDDLALEAALLGRPGGELVRAQPELVELRAGISHWSAIISAEMPWGTRLYFDSSSSGQGLPTSSTHLKPTPIGMWPMCSTPEPITTSWTPEAISAAPKFTACWAEPHWRSTVVAGVSTGRPGLEPGVAADVEHLLAVLLHAAGDDVLDLLGRDARALDDLRVGLAEQLVRVGVLVVALLGVPAPDRRADRLDDYDLTPTCVLHLDRCLRSRVRQVGYSIDW